jgi:hypothetical protein
LEALLLLLTILINMLEFFRNNDYKCLLVRLLTTELSLLLLGGLSGPSISTLCRCSL